MAGITKRKKNGTRGTSYATGYVSAEAANIIMNDPNLTPEEIRDILYRSATDIGPIGYDDFSGWGLLSREAE